MQKKKLLAVLLAVALSAAPMSMAALAVDDPAYPVGGVLDTAYTVDDDGYVDLSDPTDLIAYGGTVYFPLLNENYLGGGSAYFAAQNAFNTANSALGTAISTYLSQLTVSGMMSGWNTASDFGSSGAYSFNAATFNTAFGTNKTNAGTALTNANNALTAAQGDLATAQGILATAQSDLATAQGNLTTAQNNVTGAGYASVSAAQTQEGVLEGYQSALATAVSNAGGSFDGSSDYAIASGSNAAKLVAYDAALTAAGAAGTAMMAQIGLYDAVKGVTDYAAKAAAIKSAKDTFDVSAKDETAANAYVDAVKAQLGSSDTTVAVGPIPDETEWSVTLSADAQALLNYQITFVPLIVSDLLTAYDAVSGIASYSAKASAIVAAQANYGSAQSAELATLSPLLVAYASAQGAVTTAQGAVDDAQGDVNDAQDAVDDAQDAADAAQALKDAYDSTALATAVGNVVTAKATYDQKKSDLDALTPSTDPYPFVYETDSRASSARIKATWELGKTLVKGVEIVKKKATGVCAEAENFNIGSQTSIMRYIYFVAVATEKKTTTSVADLDGIISLKRTGTPGYDFEFDVSMTIGYEYAEESIIEIDPLLFKEDYGFYGDEEEQFDFECDEDSYFLVNTLSQGKIVLAADTDYDYDIAELYPKANLDFFNGNGASFNKIGELHLAADEDTYLYYVKDNGDLGELSKSQYEYDDYEEAFIIKTRTLGRYVISDSKLTLVSSPSSGSSSSVSVAPVPGSSSGNPLTGAAL